jgi:hypothetical protein
MFIVLIPVLASSIRILSKGLRTLYYHQQTKLRVQISRVDKKLCLVQYCSMSDQEQPMDCTRAPVPSDTSQSDSTIKEEISDDDTPSKSVEGATTNGFSNDDISRKGLRSVASECSFETMIPEDEATILVSFQFPTRQHDGMEEEIEVSV